MNMTQRGVWGRGILYTLIAVLGFLLGDEAFRAAVPPLVLTTIGAFSVGFIALRAYLDQSISQEQRDTQRQEDEAEEGKQDV